MNVENTILNLDDEEISYIQSEDLISNFGDWEKANRLEKFRFAGSIEKDGKIILNGSDITSKVENLIKNDDRKRLQALEKDIGKTILGKYKNDDTGIVVNVSNRNVTEISNHHYLFKEHIQSLAYIPEIIEKATFIAEVENEDKRKHPNIEKYLYFGTGLNLAGDDYTCKSVIGVDSSKNCYYDQSLSTIEKEKLIDFVLQNKKVGNLSPLITQRETDLEGNEMPYIYYDKRLINICQVPQMPYLEKVNGKWLPTKETVNAVKTGKLYIQKNGQEYRMIDLYSKLIKEEISYIQSEEFISKFGDWEKANRLEKLKKSKSLLLNKKIIVFGKDRTEEINRYREEKNIRALSRIVSDISQEMVQNLRFEQNLTQGESPILKVYDGNRAFNINISMLKDVSHHNLLQKGHIESIFNIPKIVRNALYIGKENNEDNRKPELKQFYYFAEGIRIENNDYTAKVVFTKNNNGEFFYDQSLSTVEKSQFLESIKKLPEVLNQINRLEYFGNSDGTPSTYYDKRLINICQVPQMPYLEKVNGKWLPKKESIDAVKAGKLYIKKNEQEYRMIDNRSSQKNDDMSFYYKNFARMPQKENEVAQLQKALALALEKNVLPLKEVELNRENWNKMFPDGTVETPVATVKLGENQFSKLCRSDRNNLLAAMYETLSNPAIVLEKETLDEKSGEFKLVNVYGKSFIHEDSKHKRAVESVIIFKDGKNISIGTHNKNIKDFVKQIKTADQIIYTDSEISRVASLILQNGGSRVRLHDAISNRVINSHYDKNNLLSINNLQFSESKNNLKELFENRFSGEIESFKNDNFDFLKSSTLSYELDEEKDFALMSDISDVLAEGEVFTKRNENIDGEIKIKLGDLFDKKNPGKILPTGLRHLIKHRMEERLNNGLSMENSQKETTAILFLAVNNIDKAPAVKEPNGKYAIYKDGIRTTIGKDKKGKFVVSGFDYADTKREATESIGTVIARYGYTPGFLEIYDQVGAVASELNIHKENSVVNKNENTNTSIEKSKISNITKFEYDGLTYIPIRALSENEKELINNQTPKNYWSNSIIEKPKNGENYSIEDFKKKSQSQDIDLFYCIERGKFFTPVENGIINLNEGSIDEHFRKELSNFYNNENIQELIKNHRPLVFNKKEDISLMKSISSVLTESEVFYKNNETLGDVRIRFGNPGHNGLSHIIKRRMDKLIKHEGMNYDDAVKETSAILFLSLQNISNAPATKEINGRYAIYKNGIKTAIDTDKNGKFVVTGFNFNDTKQEAADAIKSVNALYGYTPEFLDIYAQVGAAYASLNNNIPQQNSPVNDKKSDYEKLLYSSAEINVNGTIRHCKDGLIKGFENAVSRLESYFAENSSLKNENARLKSQIECMNSKCEKLIQDNEELKKQALKNKIRPMGM